MKLKVESHNKTKDPFNKWMDKKVSEIIDDIDKQKTAALIKALSDNGEGSTKIEDIKDRCEFVNFPNRQIFRLDGKDLLEFMPVESEEVMQDGKMVIIFKQKMRKLY